VGALLGLRFNFAGGWENTSLAKGSKSVDLIDRTDSANHPNWIVVKSFVVAASNCITPPPVVSAMILSYGGGIDNGSPSINSCSYAYNMHVDPVTNLPYVANPMQSAPSIDFVQEAVGDLSLIPGYPGYDPRTAPNNRQGFDKDLSGNELPECRADIDVIGERRRVYIVHLSAQIWPVVGFHIRPLD